MKKQRGFIADFLIVMVQATIIALVVRSFLFQSFNIPSGSLVPTLLVGDYVFVSKYAYGYSKHSFPFSFINFEGRVLGANPKRGDIAVFHNDKDQGKDYIKRVIGLPGDAIQMRDGVLFINDVAVKKERVGTFETDKPDRILRKVPRYVETLPNGVSYTTIEVDNGRGYLSHTGVFNVPAGHYFMMGDNREDSQDSRVPSQVGFVPIDNFIGRAEMVYFSVDSGIDERGYQKSSFAALNPNNIRWDRIFSRVR
jgi:signal peptidase I